MVRVCQFFGTTLDRRHLLQGLKEALEDLRSAGCQTAYVGGSFITAKPNPGDFDACWDVEGVILELLDPVFLMFENERVTQKAKYGGELFPAQLPEGTSGITFFDFFQTDADGRNKGVVALDLESVL